MCNPSNLHDLPLKGVRSYSQLCKKIDNTVRTITVFSSAYYDAKFLGLTSNFFSQAVKQVPLSPLTHVMVWYAQKTPENLQKPTQTDGKSKNFQSTAHSLSLALAKLKTPDAKKNVPA